MTKKSQHRLRKSQKRLRPVPKHKYAPELIAKARDMYLNYKTVAEVARETYISRSTINYYINKGWDKERKAREELNLAKLNEINAMDLKSIGKNSIVILKRALDNVANGENPPSIRDAQAVSKIIETIQKLNEEVSQRENAEKEALMMAKQETTILDPLKD